MRAGVARCGEAPPCDTINTTSVPDSVLSDFEDAAYEQCIEERLQEGYLLLHLTGPLMLLATLLMTCAHFSQSRSLTSIGVVAATIATAILLKGISVLLTLDYGIGWGGLISCNGKDSSLVSEGVYLGEFDCVDQTVGGEHRVSSSWAWMNDGFNLYFAGAPLSLSGIIVILWLLMTPWGRGRLCTCQVESASRATDFDVERHTRSPSVAIDSTPYHPFEPDVAAPSQFMRISDSFIQ